jgi:hypothetical protein
MRGRLFADLVEAVLSSYRWRASARGGGRARSGHFRRRRESHARTIKRDLLDDSGRHEREGRAAMPEAARRKVVISGVGRPIGWCPGAGVAATLGQAQRVLVKPGCEIAGRLR